MAGHLKKYGMYWVFAGMVTTGTFVWNSLRKDLNGESYAAMYNGAMERLLIPALTRTGSPVWYPYGEPTNLFPSALLTKDFMNRLADKAVQAAIGVSFVYDAGLSNGTLSLTGGIPTNKPYAWLLDDSRLYEGSTTFVSRATGVVTGTNAPDALGLSWRFDYAAAPSNQVDGAMCQTTIRQPGALPFPRYAQGTNAPLSGVVMGSAATGFSFTLPAEGCAWNTNRGRVAFSFYSQERPYDRMLYKRDLTGPADLLTNLTRTVYSLTVPASTIEKRTSGIFTHSDSSAIIPVTEYLAEANTTPTFDSTSQSAFPYWNNYFQYTHHGKTTVEEGSGDTHRNSSTVGDNGIRFPSAFNAGQPIEYPSTYALTNGYVARLRVYGIFSYSIDHGQAWLTAVSRGTNSVPYLSYSTAFSPKIDDVPGFSFSEPLSEVDTTAYDGHFSMSNLGYDFDYDQVNVFCATPKLALLLDVSQPSNTVSWSDVPVPAMTAMSTPSSFFERATITSYHVTNGVAIHYDLTEEYTYFKKTVNIVMEHAFVVVDWNWKHLNPNNPYIPPE